MQTSVRGAYARSAGARASAHTSAEGAYARIAGAHCIGSFDAGARTSVEGAYARSAAEPEFAQAERMQGQAVRWGGRLPTPAHQEQMQGVRGGGPLP